MLSALAFLLLYLAGCLLALSRHPIYGLVTYVGTYYATPPTRWWGGLLPDLRWAFTAAAVTFLAMQLHSRRLAAHGRLLSHRIVFVMVAFLAWVVLQSPAAYQPELHHEYVSLYAKFLLVLYLIYRCLDSERNLRMFLWANVVGCAYWGWVAYTEYRGGRFEGFGGATGGEANASGLQLVVGACLATVLFLTRPPREKALVALSIPLILNAIVTTISRSSFLALLTAALVFNVLTPRRYRFPVRVLSALALASFVALTTASYWERIGTIKYLGAEVEGIDTGGGRLHVMARQWEMFLAHPWGCGHRCTDVLSAVYIDEKYLDSSGSRSSHNTFMSALVDHGVVGGAVYLLTAFWVLRSAYRLRGLLFRREGFGALLGTAVVASLVTILVGDMFVSYTRLEVRYWLMGILMVLLDHEAAAEKVPAGRKRGAWRTQGAPAAQARFAERR